MGFVVFVIVFLLVAFVWLWRDSLARNDDDSAAALGYASRRKPRADLDADGLRACLADLDTEHEATARQVAALSRLGISGGDDLSKAQASAVLSARDYAEGCAIHLFGQADDYAFEDEFEIETTLFILRDRSLRDRAIRWNDHLYMSGDDIPSVPPGDEAREKVTAFMMRLVAEKVAAGEASVTFTS